jgi:hypothetical protein
MGEAFSEAAHETSFVLDTLAAQEDARRLLRERRFGDKMRLALSGLVLVGEDQELGLTFSALRPYELSARSEWPQASSGLIHA